MTGERNHAKTPSTGGPQPPARRRWILTTAAAVVLVAAAIGVLALWPLFTTPREAMPAATRGGALVPEAQRVAGRWLRPDGGYVLEIRSVAPDGRLDAAYFNPSPINVAQARVRTIDGPVEVFVELRDANCPGATYRLVHEPADDTLIGLYTQPAVGQTFEVTFVRER
jgi:hypothetical protein